MIDRVLGTVDRRLLLLTGIVVGAGAGVLLAPASGARTRRRLGVMVEDLREKGGEIAADARWHLDRVIERGNGWVA